MFYKGYVINDEKFLKPHYSISPFRTEDVIINRKLEDSNSIDEYLNQKFDGKKYIYTINGREAISIALSKFNLSKQDCVTILTTSQNFYISGCVTKEIEKHCKWSREITHETKIIFINHEFGFPYENLSDILKYKLPIIEDCAHSFASQNKEETVGKIGDFVVYSLPKFFPVQMGGILKSNKKINIKSIITEDEKKYLQKVLSHNISNLDKVKRKRIKNYKYLKERLKLFGFEERFELKEKYCPSIYLFKTKNIDLIALKNHMQNHGIECSVFYNEETFFLPINDKLDFDELDYFVELIKLFLKLGDIK